MLKLSKHHYLSLPDLGLGFSRPMELTPLPTDSDDLLTQAIAADPAEHDDNWELSERPDTRELQNYWQHVEEDMQADPDAKLSTED